MSHRIAVVAIALCTLSACTIVRAALADDLRTNVVTSAIFIATAAACIIWYGAGRTEHVTARVEDAEHEIRTDVVLTAIGRRRRSIAD